jgi:3-oxoacyl-[acyl-carrier protein] reductase
VAPGPTDTDSVHGHERTPEFIASIPVGRLGDPSDIASAVYFLVSPQSTWTTGQVLSVSGGVVI